MPDASPHLHERTRSSEQLLDGKLLKVHRDEVELPDGTASVREWIDHPGAAAVVALLPDGHMLMVRQFRYPPRRVFLEVPAGKLDKPGEDPEAVARRELTEETGYTAETFHYLGRTYPCIGYSNEVIHLYLADGLEKVGEQALETGEHLEVTTLGFTEAVRMAQRGEILDAKSALALLMADAYLKDRKAELDAEKWR